MGDMMAASCEEHSLHINKWLPFLHIHANHRFDIPFLLHAIWSRGNNQLENCSMAYTRMRNTAIPHSDQRESTWPVVWCLLDAWCVIFQYFIRNERIRREIIYTKLYSNYNNLIFYELNYILTYNFNINANYCSI